MRVRGSSRPDRKALAWLLSLVVIVSACGTFEVSLEEGNMAGQSPVAATSHTEQPPPLPTATSPGSPVEGRQDQVIAWYGTIHNIAGGQPVVDYFKPWHLNIWPKYGPAVGITDAEDAITDEIDRLRNTDIRVTLWGRLTCGQGGYGNCQVLVTQISANDGGPIYPPEQVTAWEGTVGRLPAQPGSQEDRLYFSLAAEIPIVYGVTSTNPELQDQLERLAEIEARVLVWGELQSRVQPLTGTLIDVERLELVEQP